MKRSALDDRRLWLAGGAFAVVLIAVASWFFLISPRFASADDLDGQHQDAQSQNSVLAAKNAKLAAASRNLGALRGKLTSALTALPPDTALAAFTRDVTAIAAAGRVSLSTISISPPADPTLAAPPAPAGSSPTAASPTPGAAPAAANVVTIDVTLTTSGTLLRQQAFLHDLQGGTRRVLVASSQLSVAGNSRTHSVDAVTSMTTQLRIFTAPMTAAQLKSVQNDLGVNADK